jgi:hypothetical protein
LIRSEKQAGFARGFRMPGALFVPIEPPKRFGSARIWMPRGTPATTNKATISAGTFQYDVTPANGGDKTLGFTFVHWTFPAVSIEVGKGLNGSVPALLGTVASPATDYCCALACETNEEDSLSPGARFLSAHAHSVANLNTDEQATDD